VRVALRLNEFVRRQREPVVRYVVPVLERTRLLGPVWRLYERFVAVGVREPAVDEHGMAIPPAYLQILVTGTAGAEGFLRHGRRDAATLRELFREAGLELEQCSAVLDFGCGCGRILRHWPADGATVWHGCDLNPRLVEWCARNLRHAKVRVSSLEPPAPYAAQMFDAVYVISVFTHLPEPRPWLRELGRLLRPGGRLLLTTHGEAAAHTVLLDDELERYERGELVTRFADEAGSNLCNAYQSPAATRAALVADVEVLVHRPAVFEGQDAWVVAFPPAGSEA
jgi:SAM-dependent methyltransferase